VIHLVLKREKVEEKLNEVNAALYEELGKITDPWMERDRMAGVIGGGKVGYSNKNSKYTGHVPNKTGVSSPVSPPPHQPKTTTVTVTAELADGSVISNDSVDEFDPDNANLAGEDGWGHTRGGQGGGYGF
jgi:hypothetical protein